MGLEVQGWGRKGCERRWRSSAEHVGLVYWISQSNLKDPHTCLVWILVIVYKHQVAIYWLWNLCYYHLCCSETWKTLCVIKKFRSCNMVWTRVSSFKAPSGFPFRIGGKGGSRNFGRDGLLLINSISALNLSMYKNFLQGYIESISKVHIGVPKYFVEVLIALLYV